MHTTRAYEKTCVQNKTHRRKHIDEPNNKNVNINQGIDANSSIFPLRSLDNTAHDTARVIQVFQYACGGKHANLIVVLSDRFSCSSIFDGFRWQSNGFSQNGKVQIKELRWHNLSCRKNKNRFVDNVYCSVRKYAQTLNTQQLEEWKREKKIFIKYTDGIISDWFVDVGRQAHTAHRCCSVPGVGDETVEHHRLWHHWYPSSAMSWWWFNFTHDWH